MNAKSIRALGEDSTRTGLHRKESVYGRYATRRRAPG